MYFNTSFSKTCSASKWTIFIINLRNCSPGLLRLHVTMRFWEQNEKKETIFEQFENENSKEHHFQTHQPSMLSQKEAETFVVFKSVFCRRDMMALHGSCSAVED